ncbi:MULTISPECIES: PHB depolymerase family esterase [unclassified Streptomyces]|uniref:alpha/beta hydrolase family esterase n=1 Tax=unclassified Streptomyces TaxID=2593676 RepID=UPI000DB902AC|nr:MULTISPECIES: PHB depolymerase family esterase [unclassified Streptomyces]MYT68912.1 alpha/beta hydrolase fold domain-containing protein [Streptomyces sp. SID8367]RAJ82418.1 poly(3-hydroxybutyrate) depolymerase [Streptomyces sp. PsTaAH-137]
MSRSHLARLAASAVGALLAAAVLTPGPAVAQPHRAAGSAGCGTPTDLTPGASTARSLTVDGERRDYLVHLPASYDPDRPTPLVLSFHGHGRTSDYQERLTGMNALDAVVVYPQGVIGTDGRSAWEGAPYSADVDDIAFTNALIDASEKELCVNPRRVFASGKSNGGGFAAVVACRLADRIAATAVVSGAFYPQSGACDPRRPVPVLDFHGQADTTIPYDGNPEKGLPALPDWLAGWAERDGCAARPSETQIKDNVVRQRWRSCDDGSALEHYRITDGGHVWPSTAPNEDSATPTTIDATPLIWKFLTEHPLPKH